MHSRPVRLTFLLSTFVAGAILAGTIRAAPAGDETDLPQNESPETSALHWLETGKVKYHVFGGWSYGETDENRYLEGSPAGNADVANLALNLSAQPSKRLLLAAQAEVHSQELGVDETEVELDFLYATWWASDQISIRLGRIKHPFGLYSELFDLGTVRPFLRLPQSIYGPSGIAGESLDGGGLTGRFEVGGALELSYDLYFGELELLGSEPWDLLALEEDEDGEDDEGEDGTELFIEEKNRNEVVGGRLVLTHSRLPITFGVSAYTGVADDQELGEETGMERRDTAAGAQFELRNDRLWVSAELAWLDEEGEVSTTGGYLEVAPWLTSRLQLALRYEHLDTEVEELELGADFEALAEHDAWSIGFAWWFREHLVAKIALHEVDGNRFALPE
ncbi:MAG: hypothetical protein MI919_03160, partial [Holophagales bacterium]|nr:hypothetical protein [Holophagales bacterium]